MLIFNLYRHCRYTSGYVEVLRRHFLILHYGSAIECQECPAPEFTPIREYYNDVQHDHTAVAERPEVLPITETEIQQLRQLRQIYI